jgi:YesN/AraC family two-component response regulator
LNNENRLNHQSTIINPYEPGAKVLKTLIVEDNRFNRETLTGLLKRYFSSMIIEEASDGNEALQKVDSFQPDLILMDIRLPDVSGLDLIKKIKITNSAVKVIVLTGHHYPEYEETAAQYGADGFLVKGGPSKEILAAVESFFPRAKESTLT